MGRSALSKDERSAPEKLSESGQRAREALPGSASTQSPVWSPAVWQGVPCGGVQALEGKTGVQPESLTSPRPEAQNASFAPCDHLSASRLGPEAARVPSGPAPAALVPASQAPLVRLQPRVGLGGPGAALGR